MTAWLTSQAPITNAEYLIAVIGCGIVAMMAGYSWGYSRKRKQDT